MRILKVLILCGICLVVFTACQSAAEPMATPLQTEETSEVVPPTPTDAPPPTPSEVPTEPAEEAAVVGEVDQPVDECQECHIDKERLIDTAKPEEDVESESSGEG